MKNLPPEHSAGLFLSAALAFVGGYTDAATYVASTVFAGHISGNCVLLAISLVLLNRHDSLIRAGAVVFIVLGIIASSLLETPRLRRSAIPPFTIALFVEALLFLVPGITTLLHHPIATVWSVMLLCIALGVQTGAIRRTEGTDVYTVFIAGVVTRLTERMSAKLEDKNDTRGEHAGILATLFACFMAGALAGTVVAIHLPLWTYFAMAVLLLVLAAQHSVRAHRIRAGKQQGTQAASLDSLEGRWPMR